MNRPIDQVREALCAELSEAFGEIRRHLQLARGLTGEAGAHIESARAHAIATGLCAAELGRIADALERAGAEPPRAADDGSHLGAAIGYVQQAIGELHTSAPQLPSVRDALTMARDHLSRVATERGW